MKKKIAALDLRIQLVAVVIVLVAIAAAGYSLMVAPLGAQALKLQQQVSEEQAQAVTKRAELKSGEHPPAIQVADIFKLDRAMPETEDMPGIILTLSNVAEEAGISFSLIEPVTGVAQPSGGVQVVRVHLLFNGDFYGLSDFLYRLRSLVTVHNGALNATGRLFDVDSVSFDVSNDSFPQIQAELYVDAYLYGGGSSSSSSSSTPPSTTTTTTTTPTDTTTTDDSSDLPDDATAAGAQP